MNRIYLVIVTLLAGVFEINAQHTNVSAKVLAAFTQSQIAAMSEEELAWNTFIADNMCVISQMTPEKTEGFTTIEVGNQTDATTETFNPLLINLQPLEHQNQYYIISGTTRTLFVLSKDRLNIMYECTKKKNKN